MCRHQFPIDKCGFGQSHPQTAIGLNHLVAIDKHANGLVGIDKDSMFIDLGRSGKKELMFLAELFGLYLLFLQYFGRIYIRFDIFDTCSS